MCEWLILLLFLCRCNHGGNVCCDNWQNNKDCSCYRRSDNDYKQSRRNNGDCGRNRSCDDDCDCDRRNDYVWERNTSCGCEGDEFIQTRTFSGFQNQSTCGCENKNE